MATGGDEHVGYSLANVGTVTLENANETPDYYSIVICQNKIIVLDNEESKVKIYRLHDGKFMDMLDSSDSEPNAICLMDATTICVLHDDGLIEMASIKSEDMSPVFTRMKSFRLDGVFDDYLSVIRVKDDIVVVGVKQDTTYWCIASLDEGHVDTIHQICKSSNWSGVTTKDNIIYILCYAGVADDATGVYAFDILNPSQCKYEYKHQRLRYPTSIVINEDGNIFVGNYGVRDTSSIHQLTASCQLVAIFTQGIPRGLYAMFWDNGRLYVACFESPDITVFRHVYPGSHKESEVLASYERKQLGIEELTIQIAQVNIDNGQSSVKTEMPPSGLSPKNYEDEKKGNHSDSEVQISDEGKQPVIEGTSTQIGKANPIEQSVEEELKQAGIKMSTKERDLFIKFQNEIGTDIYFSPHRLTGGQNNLNATEIFIEQSHPDMRDKWLEYRSQGKLTRELIDVIYAKERNPDLHANKDKFLKHMENLNIIVKARSFDENGVKKDNYFFAPCMLHLESQGEVVAPEQDPRMFSTSVLCWVFTGPFVSSSIFERLLAACIARWPVAKKNNSSRHQISHVSTLFELDLTHRLTLSCDTQELRCKNHVIFATVTWLVIDDIKAPDAKLCTRVRMFISQKLSKIINSLKQNIPYKLYVQIQESQDVQEDNRIRFSPFKIWLEDEIHDPDSSITPEHMNHARLCIALVTVCGKALREMLLDKFPVPYRDIYQAILANQAKLTCRLRGRPLLNQEQINLVFVDPRGQQTGTVERFDISLLYTLIRNVSTVQAPLTGWGIDPQPWDTSLGASVERIRIYRNHISGHDPDARMNQQDFEDSWQRLEKVLHDIEVVINRHVYITELEKQRRQVISIFNAC